MPPTYILVAVFAFVTLSVMGILSLLFSRRSAGEASRLRARIDRLMRTGDGSEDQPLPQDSILREEFRRKSPVLPNFHLRLEQAGLSMPPRRFALIWALFIVFGGLLGSAHPTGTAGLLVGAAVGGWLPLLILKLKRRLREKAFEKQFPEALRLLVTSLRVGHSLAVGIQMLGEELPAPVSREFQKVAEESKLGLRIEDALQGMLQRIASPDLRFFVASVMIQRETGGNLAAILEQLDEMIRLRFRIRGQVKALTAPGRMTGGLLAVMPIAMGGILTLLNPTYMSPLWHTTTGRAFVIGALVLQALGFLVIRRIVNVQL